MLRPGWLGFLLVVLTACDSANEQASDASDVRRADAEADAAVDSALPAVCSGCPREQRDLADVTVRVHHVHLNVKNSRETIGFYAKFFGAREVRLNDREIVLWADPILFLLEETGSDFPDTLEMGLEHVGLGVDDPVAWFEQANQNGLQIDTRNGAPAAPISMPALATLSPFLDPGVDTFAYVYVRGPNQERIEVWSGLERFRHVHFMTKNVDETVAWYAQLLNSTPIVASAADNLGIGNGLELGGGVQLFYASMPPIAEFVPTDDRPVGHIAFSVTKLDAMFARTEQLGLGIVSAPELTHHGFRSFFVRGPDQVLLEFVEAGPVTLP